MHFLTIYVVKRGDTVYSLSQAYGVSPERIINANGLPASGALVVGQALVIPSKEFAYRVKPGETLWSIGRKFNVSPENIARFNNITNPESISPGMVLRIPETSKNYGYIESNAFIQPSNPERENTSIREAGPYLTYISPFSRHATADGGLTPLADTNIVNTARNYLDAPLLSVTNIGTENFDTNLGHQILTNDTAQTNLINNITGLLRTGGYYGVVVDFERIPPSDRQRYNSFLRRLANDVHSIGKILATALAPKTYDITEGAWHGAHDYRAHGQIVDFSVIMTYEWGWSGGPPMAVAPLNEVAKVIDYAVSVMPRKKIMMGIPYYGYDWTLPYTPGGEFAKSVGNEEAVDIARTNGAIIQYDYTAQSPFFNYVDKNRNSHVVWFEDARSIRAKLLLASRQGLRGVSYWALGKPFKQNWEVLNNMFNIVKVIR